MISGAFRGSETRLRPVDNCVNNYCGEGCGWTGICVTWTVALLQPALALQSCEELETGM